MTIEQAIGRIQWRFTKGNFTPDKKDVECLNHIIDWINQQRTAVIQHDTHFAKLYCHVLGQEVNFYGGSMEFAQKKMHEYLSKTTLQHYETFEKTLNEACLNTYTKSIGMSNKHPMAKSDKEAEKDERLIKEFEPELIKYLNGIWDKEEVFEHLNAQISESIHLYRTKP